MPAAAKSAKRPSSGRARRALNRITHGLRSNLPVIPGVEREEDWLIHLAGVVESLEVVGMSETLLAERFALKLWCLRRVARYETQLVTAADPNAEVPDDSDDEDDSSSDGQSAADPLAGMDEWERFEALEPERARYILNCFDQILFADEAAAVDSDVALAVVDSVRSRTCGFPLDSFAVPGAPDTPLTQFDAWTAGLTRRTMRAICERFHKDHISHLQGTVDHYREVLARYDSPRRPADDDDDGRDPRLPGRRPRTNTMPIDSDMARMIEYERHISRELHTTLQALDLLQSRRLGRTVARTVRVLPKPGTGGPIGPDGESADSDKRNGRSQIASA